MRDLKKIVNKGFTLIEMMIVLVIGSIVLIAVTQLVISSSKLNETTQEFMRNLQSASTVLDSIGQEARRAGYSGCNPVEKFEYSKGGQKESVYPIEIFKGANNKVGVMFTYGVSINKDHYGNFVSVGKDCLNNELIMFQIGFINCGGSDSHGICFTTSPRGSVKVELENMSGNLHPQDVVDRSLIFQNVKLDKMVFGIPVNTAIGKETFRVIEVDDSTVISDDMLKEINKAITITVYVTIDALDIRKSDKAMTRIQKSYSSIYSLKK